MVPLTDDILELILNLAPEVEYAAIASSEGFHMASVLPQGVDETKLAAIIASLLSLSEGVVGEMKKSDFEEIFIKGSDGYLIIIRAGPKNVLAVSTSSDLNLNLISKIKEILRKSNKFGADYGYKSPFPNNPPNPPNGSGNATLKKD